MRIPRSKPYGLSAVAGLLSLALFACDENATKDDSKVVPEAEQDLREKALLAGSATVFDSTRDAFSLPWPNLSREHRSQFFLGNSFFNQNWVSAPASVTTRDGLGPLFNAHSCSGCHFKDGRGRPPYPGEPLQSMLIRISVQGVGAHGGPLADPTYGDQIQGRGIAGVPGEADVIITYEEVPGHYADGTPYSLRRPHYRLDNLGYGATSAELLMSPRVAPALVGLGLLEAVLESDLRAMADPDDEDGDGISGRVNTVWNASAQAQAVGRFGWKAEQPSVKQQTAGAFAGDMGITSSLFSAENHTARQGACEKLPNGGVPEVSDAILDSVVLYARTLAVPARRNLQDTSVQNGERLFERARCDSCHVATLKAASIADLPELTAQFIHPYSDLLLHDMGESLSDHRPTFAAQGNEWRTPPLWGIGLVHKVNEHTFFLHDGRARDLSEAVLWHDGEARASREAFLNLSRAERQDLIAFLESL